MKAESSRRNRVCFERLSWCIENRGRELYRGKTGIRGKPSSGIYASFSCGVAIDKRGQGYGSRCLFVRFVRPQTVKIAALVSSPRSGEKGPGACSRYKFEDSGNSAIRAATRVTSFPPDYLANGEGAEDCVGNVYPPSMLLTGGSASRKYRLRVLSLSLSLRAAFNKRALR